MRRETADQSDDLHSPSVKVFFMGSVKSVQISFQHAMLKPMNNQDSRKSKNLLMKVQFKEDYRFSYPNSMLFKNPVPLFSVFSI